MSSDDSPLADTQVHRVRSSAVGDDFKVLIGHCGAPGGQPQGALYLTDANGFFGLAVDLIRSLQLALHLPPLLVVGIGCPLAGWPRQPWSARGI